LDDQPVKLKIKLKSCLRGNLFVSECPFHRKSPLINSRPPAAGFLAPAILAAMILQSKTFACVLGMLAAVNLVQAADTADSQVALALSATNSPVMPDTRYGLFNGLDHRSWYNEGDFPEPFLVDDSGLEINEARLDWLHTGAGSQHSDIASAEVEKGFGLTTLELRVPYERDVSSDQISQGIGNVEVGARHPFYQYVSATGFFDNTLGAAVELGIPVNSEVSKNTELVPKIFNDLRVGEHFTLQSLFGYSTLFGGSPDGGLQNFEYGFVFGYSIPHSQLPLPGVQQLIPIFEIKGETQMNQDAAGSNNLLGDAAFRVNLNTIGQVQPRLGLGFVFPMNDNARTDVHWGIFTSLVFEY
jgi:hypothetical protein